MNNYIYLSDFSVAETQKKIASGEIELEKHTDEENKVWICNKDYEEQKAWAIVEKSMKVGA